MAHLPDSRTGGKNLREGICRQIGQKRSVAGAMLRSCPIRQPGVPSPGQRFYSIGQKGLSVYTFCQLIRRRLRRVVQDSVCPISMVYTVQESCKVEQR